MQGFSKRNANYLYYKLIFLTIQNWHLISKAQPIKTLVM
jgi:hypothetical protein